MNKVTYIDYQEFSDGYKWIICLTINELNYEELIENLKQFEVYSCEEDRFGKDFLKRLGA